MADKIPWSYKYPPCKMLEYTTRNSEKDSSIGSSLRAADGKNVLLKVNINLK